MGCFEIVVAQMQVLGSGRDVPMPETLLDKGNVPLPRAKQIGRVRVTLHVWPDTDPGSALQSAISPTGATRTNC